VRALSAAATVYICMSDAWRCAAIRWPAGAHFFAQALAEKTTCLVPCPLLRWWLCARTMPKQAPPGIHTRTASIGTSPSRQSPASIQHAPLPVATWRRRCTCSRALHATRRGSAAGEPRTALLKQCLPCGLPCVHARAGVWVCSRRPTSAPRAGGALSLPESRPVLAFARCRMRGSSPDKLPQCVQGVPAAGLAAAQTHLQDYPIQQAAMTLA
jgi:hypothetical protein